ncbi:SDR family NAD(P)-dependent oxidoreductase [Neisseriaceae bacterium TC5R-5]|nr:SDR family NAD(P)-dependent oxidoreductase [Neisseriaceae bacterium TC5R-5]
MLFKPFNPPIRQWAGQRVWIIGSSSGIGAALAQQLLQQDAQVILSARNQSKLQQIAANSPLATVLPLDISDPAAWQRAWQQLQAQHCLPDLTLFCAADYQPQSSWQLQATQVNHTLQTNLTGVYYGLELLLPALLAQGHGGIALVASVAGYIGLPGACVYGPSKAALINLAELLYAELHPRGLSVTLINPGFVQTPLTAKNSFHMPALQTPAQAASHILRGLQQGRFEIHFPYRFTLWLKLLQLLPYRLRLPLLSKLKPR